MHYQKDGRELLELGARDRPHVSCCPDVVIRVWWGLQRTEARIEREPSYFSGEAGKFAHDAGGDVRSKILQ